MEDEWKERKSKWEVEETKKNLTEKMEFQLRKPWKELQVSINNEVKVLNDKVNDISNEVRATRSHVDNSVNKRTGLSTSILQHEVPDLQGVKGTERR